MDSLSASIRNAFLKGWFSWHSIRLCNNLRDEEAKLRLPVDIATIMTEAHKKSQSGEIAAIAGSWDEKSLISLIYGSNVIETAGPAAQPYKEHLENLAETHRKSDITNVIRSRREIIGHENALHFITDHIILNNEA
ncbi:hypothetical protein J3459_015386 [Metarhizium acridum]|uniref:uncharacterized protein n=1 Tax=Metarhizium acridum TaxID=92637 RepID=UPI001C6B6F6B|nr:hypothetical protein J3459_015386 [Metarhizium acridum]KAG8414025.1 hypothetical protein J3458_011679 [Metarhizium acridum]